MLRLGYMLLRPRVELPWSPGHNYRGIDRLPFVPNPLVGSAERTARYWTEYSDAWNEGAIARQVELARHFQRRLREIGTTLEIAFAEIVVLGFAPQPDSTTSVKAQRERSLAWLRSRAETVGHSDPGFITIGLDVSTPIPDFHSAIFEPGIVAQGSALTDRLNESGLIDEVEVAEKIANEANTSSYGIGLFSVIRVLSEPSADPSS